MTTRRPHTAEEHAAEARRLLTLIRPTALGAGEQTEAYAYEQPANIIAAANVHATLALVEQQHTANLVAADRLDSIRTPYAPGSFEHTAFWDRHAANITERLGLTRQDVTA